MTHICTPDGLVPIDEYDQYIKDEAEKMQKRAAELAEVEKTKQEEPLPEQDDEDQVPPPDGMLSLDVFVNFLIANYCPITKYFDCIKDKIHTDLKSYLQTMNWCRFYKYTSLYSACSLPNPEEKRVADDLLRILVPINPPVGYSSDAQSPEDWRYETYHGDSLLTNIYEFAATRKFVKASTVKKP